MCQVRFAGQYSRTNRCNIVRGHSWQECYDIIVLHLNEEPVEKRREPAHSSVVPLNSGTHGSRKLRFHLTLRQTICARHVPTQLCSPHNAWMLFGGTFGGVLGVSYAVLGGLGAALGRSWQDLGRPWHALGATY